MIRACNDTGFLAEPNLPCTLAAFFVNGHVVLPSATVALVDLIICSHQHCCRYCQPQRNLMDAFRSVEASRAGPKSATPKGRRAQADQRAGRLRGKPAFDHPQN
jgi:hypothetical protein